MHWLEAETYYSTFDEKAWEWHERFSDEAVRRHIEQVEEKFRVKAIELTRAKPPIPFGRALLTALKDNHSIFSDALDTLRDEANAAKRDVNRRGGDDRPRRQKSGGEKARNSDRGAPKPPPPPASSSRFSKRAEHYRNDGF